MKHGTLLAEQSKSLTKEHAVLMTGYDEDYVYFNDPLTGEKIEKWNWPDSGGLGANGKAGHHICASIRKADEKRLSKLHPYFGQKAMNLIQVVQNHTLLDKMAMFPAILSKYRYFGQRPINQTGFCPNLCSFWTKWPCFLLILSKLSIILDKMLVLAGDCPKYHFFGQN